MFESLTLNDIGKICGISAFFFVLASMMKESGFIFNQAILWNFLVLIGLSSFSLYLLLSVKKFVTEQEASKVTDIMQNKTSGLFTYVDKRMKNFVDHIPDFRKFKQAFTDFQETVTIQAVNIVKTADKRFSELVIQRIALVDAQITDFEQKMNYLLTEYTNRIDNRLGPFYLSLAEFHNVCNRLEHNQKVLPQLLYSKLNLIKGNFQGYVETAINNVVVPILQNDNGKEEPDLQIEPIEQEPIQETKEISEVELEQEIQQNEIELLEIPEEPEVEITDSELSKNELYVLEIIGMYKVIDPKRLMEETQLSEKSIHNILTSLIEMDLVNKQDRGIYILTHTGIEYLDNEQE